MTNAMPSPIGARFTRLLLLLLLLDHQLDRGAAAATISAAADAHNSILAVFPSDYRSHFTLAVPLFAALANRGHHITIVSQFALSAAQRHANITEIRLTGVAEHFASIAMPRQVDALRRGDHRSLIDEIIGLVYGTAALANYTLGFEPVQQLLRNNGHFDVLLIDMYYNDALLGIAEHLGGIPTIVLSATATSKWTNEMVGNPHNPAYNPSLFLGYTDQMGLCERFLNALASAFEKITYNYMYVPAQEDIYQRYFGPLSDRPLPPLIDLIHNVSLVLVNSHPALQYARPATPNMLHIGGMHLSTGAAQLPDAIRAYLDAATDGCIYMSLGNDGRRSSDLPGEQIAAFARVFQSLAPRMRIVWKWENGTLPGQPTNVIIGALLPQRAILEHPSVRLFITNGGASSLLEAIAGATPIVGIPMHGDQHFNVAQAVRRGLGVALSAGNLTDASIADAIRTVLDEKRTPYADNARRLQALFNDNAVDPLRLAVHGVEQVMRTRGARHLRSPAVDLSMWQQGLFDVALMMAAVAGVIVAVPSLIICLALRRSHRASAGNGGRDAVDGSASPKPKVDRRPDIDVALDRARVQRSTKRSNSGGKRKVQ